MQKLHFVSMNGTEWFREVEAPSDCLKIHKEDIPADVKYIDVMPDYFTVETGTEGFLFIPSIEGSHYSALTFFRPRENCEEIFPESAMPIYACRRGNEAILAIVVGMKFDYSLVIGVRDGELAAE